MFTADSESECCFMFPNNSHVSGNTTVKGNGKMTITTQDGPDSKDMVLDQRSFLLPSTQATSSTFANAGAGYQLDPIASSNATLDTGTYRQAYDHNLDPTVLRQRELQSHQATQTQRHTSRKGSSIQSSESNQLHLQNCSNQSYLVPGSMVQGISAPAVPPRRTALLPTPTSMPIQNPQHLQSQ